MKLAFDHMQFELTRRCNLTCAHCVCGDAQEFDISNEIIDKFLEQTVAFDTLVFTGGEPLLNIAAMHYTLKKLQSDDISLSALETTTNGTVCSPDFVEVIKGFSAHINESIESIQVGISVDKYHVGSNPQAAIDYYSEHLKGYAIVKAHRVGNLPLKLGRGKNIPYASEPDIFETMPHYIHIFKPDNTDEYSGCLFQDDLKLRWGDIQSKVVCCPLKLSVHGDIHVYNDYASQYALEGVDDRFLICNVLSLPNDCCIDSGIDLYNARQPACGEVIKRANEIHEERFRTDVQYIVNRLRNAFESEKLNPEAAKKNQESLTLEEKVARKELELQIELAQLAINMGITISPHTSQ